MYAVAILNVPREIRLEFNYVHSGFSSEFKWPKQCGMFNYETQSYANRHLWFNQAP